MDRYFNRAVRWLSTDKENWCWYFRSRCGSGNPLSSLFGGNGLPGFTQVDKTVHQTHHYHPADDIPDCDRFIHWICTLILFNRRYTWHPTRLKSCRARNGSMLIYNTSGSRNDLVKLPASIVTDDFPPDLGNIIVVIEYMVEQAIRDIFSGSLRMGIKRV